MRLFTTRAPSRQRCGLHRAAPGASPGVTPAGTPGAVHRTRSALQLGSLLLLLVVASCRAAPTTAESPPGEASKGPAALHIEGNREQSRRELLRAVEDLFDLDAERPLTRTVVDDLAYYLAEYYRGLGFAEARVDYRLEGTEDEGLDAYLMVHEGPRFELGRVEVRGLDAELADELELDEEALRAFFGTARPTLLGTGRTDYVAQRVSRGAAELADYLYDAGFRAVEFDPPVSSAPEDGRVDVRVELRPGPRFLLQTVALDEAGRGALEPELWQALAELLQPSQGRPYNTGLAFRLVSRVREKLKKAGYPDARVELRREEDPAAGEVHLVLTPRPGERVTIERVEVRGLERTEEDYVRRRVGIRPGDRFDPLAQRQAFRNLFKTGLFERVDVRLADTPGASRPLLVELVESPAREAYAELGWGSYELLRVLLGAKDRNLFGTGKQLAFETKLGALAQGAELTLSDPFLFGEDLTGSASLFWNRREEPSFIERELGLDVGLDKAWSERFSTQLGYGFRASELADVDVNDPLVVALDDQLDLSSLTLTLAYDDRDNPFYPGRGSRARAILEWADEALGSEVEFLRGQLLTTIYRGLGKDTILALAAQAGVIVPLGDTDVIPLQERYFNGGENTVRAFRESELGPKDAGGEPIGGEAYNLLSAELRRRLRGNLFGALFFDTGNVSADYTDLFDFEGFRSGYGVGLRYLLPVGPVRLDLAANSDPRDEEDELVLHVSVGMAF